MHNNGMACILGDEMGLGKTIQVLSLFQYIKRNRAGSDPNFPFLVVAPLAVLEQWTQQTRKFTPDLLPMSFHGSDSIRQIKQILSVENNVLRDLKSPCTSIFVITTYETIMNEQRWFRKTTWDYVVLDEGHRIKDDNSKLARSLHILRAQHRLILTGRVLMFCAVNLNSY